MEKPGFPMPSPGGRVWEGLVLTQGDGETGFPHAPASGRVWEGAALPGTTFFHPVGVRRSRMDGWRDTGKRQRPQRRLEMSGSTRFPHAQRWLLWRREQVADQFLRGGLERPEDHARGASVAAGL